MKKLLLLFFLFLLLILNSNISYSYVNCMKVVYPVEVTTNNLLKYLHNSGYDYINSFCSYEKCYSIKEGKIEDSIKNFKKIYNSTLSEDDLNIINVKGYPITKIIVSDCI